MKLNLTYKDFIDNIIKTRGRHGCGEEYHERHHILPKCLGGKNEEQNLIDLYAKEHFIAHKLLAKENPHNSKLQFAWWCMVTAKNNYEKDRYITTPEEYEEAKIAYSKAIKQMYLNGYCNPMTGRHHTEETKRKISEKHKGMPMSEEAKRKISESSKGEKSYWYGKHRTEKTKEKISKHHADFKGKNHPMYGKHLSEETKKKISEKHKGKLGLAGENNPMYGKHPSKETREKISRAQQGEKNHEHRPVICIETGEWFWGATEVKNKLGINATSIGMCCRGQRKTAGGYHWKYADE